MNYKICVIGNPNTGKSSFIRRHVTGDFETKYSPTEKCQIVSLKFDTTHGPIVLNMYENPETESECLETSIVLVFHDPNNLTSGMELLKQFSDICPEAKAIHVCSKIDLNSVEERSLDLWKTVNKSTPGEFIHFISNKTCYCFERPILAILQTLTKDPRCTFLDLPNYPRL